MKERKGLVVLISLLLVCSMAGCGTEDTAQKTDSADDTETSGHASVSTVTLTSGKYSEEKLDDTWEEERSVFLDLDKDKVSVEKYKGVLAKDPVSNEAQSDTESSADHVKTVGSTVTIMGEGTYVFSGTLEDGQIIVDADKDDVVRLVLNGVEIACGSSSPFYSKGGNVIVTVADGTENTFTDAQDYQYENEGNNEPDAAIFAKDDLTFDGTGTLHVIGNYNHGIHCKDDLKFVTGTYMISAADDGIVGKDSVSVKNGNFTIESGDDGIKATNVEESDKGYILLENGSFEITAGGDGIQAETLLRVNDGNIDIVTDEGSEPSENEGEAASEEGVEPPSEKERNLQLGELKSERSTLEEEKSSKALKSYVDLIIEGGEYSLDCCDDAIHSNQNVTIKNGVFSILAEGDGIHADQKLMVDGGTIDIQKSHEGLESFEIEINGGDIQIAASDDGINAALSDEEETGDKGAVMTFNGGNIYVDADGDGLDSNGDIFINDGTLTVEGPVSVGNGTLDYVSVCKITGGTFTGTGSMGMAQNPSEDSGQPALVWRLDKAAEAGTIVSVYDSEGGTIEELTLKKPAQWFAISSPQLVSGKTYTICVGGLEKQVELDSVVTQTILEEE